jgi:hypothetical protein
MARSPGPSPSQGQVWPGGEGRIIHLAGWYEMLERAKHGRNLPIRATVLANDLARTCRG